MSPITIPRHYKAKKEAIPNAQNCGRCHEGNPSKSPVYDHQLMRAVLSKFNRWLPDVAAIRSLYQVRAAANLFQHFVVYLHLNRT